MIKIRKSTKQVILSVFITIMIAIVAFLAVCFTFVNQVKVKNEKVIQEHQNAIQGYQELISLNQQYVYIANDEIAAGDDIAEDKVSYIQVFTGLPAENYINQDDFGKTAVVDIPANVPIAKNMISENTVPGDLREEEFSVFYLNSNLQDNDYVDLRILYPNGEDYSVLSKKAVKNLSLEGARCFLWLDSEELLRISGAIIDAYLNEGTKLYTVKYIEPLVQEATIITYVPNTDVIHLIENDPNILDIAVETLSKEVRKKLESRLNSFYRKENSGNILDEQALDDESKDGQEDGYFIE